MQSCRDSHSSRVKRQKEQEEDPTQQPDFSLNQQLQRQINEEQRLRLKPHATALLSALK